MGINFVQTFKELKISLIEVTHSQVLFILSSILLAHLMEPHVYGGFVTCLAFLTVLGQFSSMGFDMASIHSIPKFISSEQWGSIKSFLTTPWVFILSISLGLNGLLLVFSYWLGWEHSNTHEGIHYLWLAIPVTGLNIYLAGVLQSMGASRQGIISKTWMTQLFFIIILGLLFCLFDQLTLFQVIFCYSISLMLTLTYQLYHLRKTASYSILQSKNEIPVINLLSISLPYCLMTSSTIIILQTGILLIRFFGQEHQVAHYFIASGIIGFAGIFSQASTLYIPPKLAALQQNMNQNEICGFLASQARFLFITNTSFLLLISCFGKEILTLWGPGYEHAYDYVWICAFQSFLRPLSVTGGMALAFLGHTGIYNKISYYTIVSIISLSCLLGFFFNVLGIAIAVAIVFAGQGIAKWLIASKILKIPLKVFLGFSPQ